MRSAAPTACRPGPIGPWARTAMRAGSRRRRMVAALLTACLAFPLAAPAAQARASDTTRLAQLLNGERTRRGLPALQILPRLAALAAAHSRDMGADGAPCREPFLHHNPDLAEQVKPASAWGENVACAGDVEQMHQALMNSPGHRANILNARWNALGTGTFDGSLLWGTQVFATVSASELRKAPATTSPTPEPSATTTTRAQPAAPPRPDWGRFARQLDAWCRVRTW